MNAIVAQPIWMKPGKELTERERIWMCRLSQARIAKFGKMPEDNATWVRQIEEIAAEIKAKREAA